MPNKSGIAMDRNLALEAVRVTEATALAASRLMGCGDEQAADEAALAAMEAALNGLLVEGVVVIGEDKESPWLAEGSKVGSNPNGPKIEIALDSIEGATPCAKGGPNALAVVAVTGQGGFLRTPRVYMDKIAVGPGLPDGVVDLDATPAENLANLAKAQGVDVSELLVCILDRPRHNQLIAQVREAGARVMLIDDGDVSGAIAAGLPQTGVDMYLGSGGAHEGVLAAAALQCLGGQMQGRLLFRSDDERAEAHELGITDYARKYQLSDMVGDNVMFAATGITDGALLRGVRRLPGAAITHSVVMRSKSGTVRYVEAHHSTRVKSGLDYLGV